MLRVFKSLHYDRGGKHWVVTAFITSKKLSTSLEAVGKSKIKAVIMVSRRVKAILREVK